MTLHKIGSIPTILYVIGGGGALAGERLFAPMREQLKQSVYSGYWERLHISPARLIDDAGIIGSALAAGQRAKHE